MVAHHDIVGNVFFEFWKIDSREKGGKGIESVERVHDRIHDAISEASFERCAPLPLVLFWPESLKKSFIVNFSYPHLISSIRQSNLNFFLFFFFIQKNNYETYSMHIFLIYHCLENCYLQDSILNFE